MIKLKDILEGTRCWKGYTKKGTKTMFGKRVPNCVKNEDLVDQAFLDAKPVNEANIKTIDIWFTDRGRFYRTVIDGKKRVRGWDSWRDAEESLSKLLGWKIYLRNIDHDKLDKAAKDLKKQGIKLTYDESMDVS
tara:strand:- start:3398 stop:3799 length:402 start_codon:yes stop_codon:yes gene_type:complete